MKPNKTQLVVILTFAGFASTARAQWTVYDPAVHTQQIIGTAQVIESASGRRIRVRVGPYATKAEAEKAAVRIKSGGLQAAVLVL